MRVEVDRGRCNGYGNCVLVAPEVFTFDDENNVSTAMTDAVPAEHVEATQLAVTDCPAQAIRVTAER